MGKKIVFCLSLILLYLYSCSTVKRVPINYSYSSKINDSIVEGMSKMIEKYEFDSSKVDFFAVVFENSDTHIVINFTYNQPDKIKTLINNTNRRILLDKNIVLPILFLTDINSQEIASSNWSSLPYGGYIVTFDNKDEVTYTGFIF